jgi:hypothetical protein
MPPHPVEPPSPCTQHRVFFHHSNQSHCFKLYATRKKARNGCLYTHALLFHPLVFFFYSGLFFAALPSTFSSSVLTACSILYSPTRKAYTHFTISRIFDLYIHPHDIVAGIVRTDTVLLISRFKYYLLSTSFIPRFTPSPFTPSSNPSIHSHLLASTPPPSEFIVSPRVNYS